jgi:hypothetical protein
MDPTTAPPRTRTARVAGLSAALALVAGLGASGSALAQMSPRTLHFLSTSQASGEQLAPNLFAARINWSAPTPPEAGGTGLTPRQQNLWPHWEGRIGILLDRPIGSLRDNTALAPSSTQGLHVRGLHLLSDYYVDGGFRATAGILRGETSSAWWPAGEGTGGLTVSMQRLDNLGLLSLDSTAGTLDNNNRQTMPYVGAGYSSALARNARNKSAWRFNADLGLLSINSNNVNRLTQVLQGDRGVDELVRSLRLRPLVKVSVGYSY